MQLISSYSYPTVNYVQLQPRDIEEMCQLYALVMQLYRSSAPPADFHIVESIGLEGCIYSPNALVFLQQLVVFEPLKCN